MSVLDARADNATPLGHPATFVERGILVPFTTPAALGARARPARRGGVEYVLPNPTGLRGVYVIPRSGLASFCTLTMHDVLLDARLAERLPESPRAMRLLAAEVAAGGTAGRAAAEAAQAAQREHEAARAAALAALRLLLVRQSGLTEGSAPLDTLVQQACAALVPRAGRSVPELERDLLAVAELYAGSGLTPAAQGPGRTDRLAEAVTGLRGQTLGWDGARADGLRLVGSLLPVAAALFEGGARRALAESRARLADVAGLLLQWGRDRFTLAHAIERADWLLDGWDQICLLWREAAESGARDEVLDEMVRLVPMLPTEAETWLGPEECSGLHAAAARGALEADGAARRNQIARNEKLRAMSC
jgi:hypothetical protein